MKYIVVLILLGSAFMSKVCLGQTTFEKKIPWKKGQPVDLNLKFGQNIQVKGWDRKEVAVIARVKINDGRQDSLFRLTGSTGDSVTILADLDHWRNYSHTWYDDGCPGDQRMMRIQGHTTLCAEITYEVDLPEAATIKLSSISANMTIRGMDGPFHAKSIAGFVDMTWPGNKRADLALKSITGELYTNIKGINWLNRKDHMPLVGYVLRGRIGPGGPKLHLESVSNDIYLRNQDSLKK